MSTAASAGNLWTISPAEVTSKYNRLSLTTCAGYAAKMKHLGRQHSNYGKDPFAPSGTLEGEGAARIAAAPGAMLGIADASLERFDVYVPLGVEHYEDDQVGCWCCVSVSHAFPRHPRS